MLKELEQFKSELAEDIKGHLDNALQEKVKTLIGDERAGIVREAVEQLRLEKLMLGHDKTGLSDAQKSEFAKFVKSIAIPSAVKANETIIGEQDSRGGYLVPTEVANAILRVAATVGVAISSALDRVETLIDKANKLEEKPTILITGNEFTGQEDLDVLAEQLAAKIARRRSRG